MVAEPTSTIYPAMGIKDFFYLQKSDRQVVLALLVLIFIALAVSVFVDETYREAPAAKLNDSQETASSDNNVADNLAEDEDAKAPAHLFPFDPNTADSLEFAKLGLKPWQIRSIKRYRAKGGVYSRPQDFAKMYGLTVGQYRALEPYIRIAPELLPASTLFEHERYDGSHRDYARQQKDYSAHSNSLTAAAEGTTPPRDTLLYPRKLRMGEQIPLTTTDTTMLKRVPGIGSGFARAIVAYGKRLGGYHSVLQLLEIRNFPESALDYFTSPTAPQLHKMNLNKLSVEQLRAHPYLDFHQAKAIADYRRLHGPLHSLHDLHLLKDFSTEAIERLQPYVEF
jgi:DNA uptake protein ComE-like DNA-binding protein